MESNIVHDFQNLRVFSNRNINRMDELVHDLTTALEETSKGIRSGSNQENSISAGAVGRVRHHKRRRGTRRTAVNIYWKRGTISEASESSIDEAIRDYIDNSVVTHSDSDDLALAYPKHRLMVPMAEPVPAVESDSFTENLSPMRPQRRRRRYKHMAVDTLESLGQLDISGPNENSNSNSTITSQTRAMTIPAAVPTSSRVGDSARVTRHHRAHTGGSRGSSTASASRTSIQNVVPGKRKRGSKNRSEGVTHDARMGTSDKDSVDLDNMDVTSVSQESSSLSSSEFDSDVYNNADEGREADDEQSDFFHEPGPTCGIPDPFIKWWENEGIMDGAMAASKQEFDSILTGALAHMPSSSQRSFRHRVEKMMAQAENGREIKIGRRKLKGKLPRYTMKRFLAERESWNMMQGGCHFSPGASWNSGCSSQSGDYKRLRQTPPLPDSAEEGERLFLRHLLETNARMAVEGFVGDDAVPIPESNIGNRMLQTMGWTPGSGLGVERDGRQDPVVAYRRRGRKGLGYETQSDT